MSVHERGSSSVLFIGLVIPVASLFLVVSLEIQQFFGLREEIQRLIDEQARLGVSREWETEDVAPRLRRQLSALSPYVDVGQIEHQRAAGSSILTVSGTFNGIFSKAFSALSGSHGNPGIPFSVYAKARRPHAVVLLVVDRTIREGEQECWNSEVIDRGSVANRLLAMLNESGVSVAYGTFPAGEEGVMLLGSEFDETAIFCSQEGKESYQGLHPLRGISGSSGALFDSVFGVASASLKVAASAEISTVVVVARNDREGARYLFDVATILATEGVSSSRKTKVVGLVVGDPAHGLQEIWRGDVSGIDLRIVPVISGSKIEPLVESAFINDLTSHVVLAR